MEELVYGKGDASFRAAGGEDGIQRLVDCFYREMDQSSDAVIIRKMHTEDLTEVKDKLFRFLVGWLGGPRLFQEKYGPIHIPNAHRGFSIGAIERDAWLTCMERAVALQPYREDFKIYLMKQLAVPAERIRNRE